MFMGEFRHNLDAKGRFIVPVKFREELGEYFIVTKGLDKCLLVFPQKEWEGLQEKTKDLPMTDSFGRKFLRFLFGGALEAERDAQGRVVLPTNLREYASITKEIVIVGVASRIEIWSKENWANYGCDDDEVDEDVIAAMREFGI